MVIFHTYVSLPEGTMCVPFEATFFDFDTKPGEKNKCFFFPFPGNFLHELAIKAPMPSKLDDGIP